MREVILYIAMSLDGYIADKNGGVDWLKGHSCVEEDTMDSYEALQKEIDTVIMGYRTYHQITAELSPDRWMYEGMESYIVTHHEPASLPEIQFVDEDPCKLVRTLQEQEGKNIWICGGASIVGQLMQEKLIDRYQIAVIPTILGAGIRLFEQAVPEVKLELTHMEAKNGITELTYVNRRK